MLFRSGLGITPGFGGTQRLPRLIGASKAKELIFTGRIITAEEALAIGLVNRIANPGYLLSSTLETARAIADNAQVAVRQSKRAVNRGIEMDLAAGLSYETEAFSLCFSTADQKEAMGAFVEKRKHEAFQNK